MKKTVIFLSIMLLVWVSGYVGRLAYYDKPRLNIYEDETSIDDYDAKFVHKLYFVEDRRYFLKVKVQEISVRSGLSIDTKRDTLYKGFWYRERSNNKQQ